MLLHQGVQTTDPAPHHDSHPGFIHRRRIHSAIVQRHSGGRKSELGVAIRPTHILRIGIEGLGIELLHLPGDLAGKIRNLALLNIPDTRTTFLEPFPGGDQIVPKRTDRTDAGHYNSAFRHKIIMALTSSESFPKPVSAVAQVSSQSTITTTWVGAGTFRAGLDRILPLLLPVSRSTDATPQDIPAHLPDHAPLTKFVHKNSQPCPQRHHGENHHEELR